MSMEPAVNTVVEVFMDRRSDYLPRLQRIAGIIADCAGTGVGESTSDVLREACDNASGQAIVRFCPLSGEVTAELREGGLTAIDPQLPGDSSELSAKVDFCLSRQ